VHCPVSDTSACDPHQAALRKMLQSSCHGVFHIALSASARREGVCASQRQVDRGGHSWCVSLLHPSTNCHPLEQGRSSSSACVCLQEGTRGRPQTARHWPRHSQWTDSGTWQTSAGDSDTRVSPSVLCPSHPPGCSLLPLLLLRLHTERENEQRTQFLCTHKTKDSDGHESRRGGIAGRAGRTMGWRDGQRCDAWG
jgi:hypothetical protein